MKRTGGLYDHILSYDNLCLAFVKASKGKRHKPEVMDYSRHLVENLESLRHQLETGRFDIGHYYFFKVLDPKPRDICAASFPERVLHHAVMAVCEPVLERYAIHHSYACRKGKGMHKAVMKARDNARIYSWFLKLDIRYMDDFLVFDHAKDGLKALLSEIRGFLDETLNLELKGNIQWNRCIKGIPFLGYRVFPLKINLSSASRSRFVRKFRMYEKKHVDGQWPESELARHVESLVAFTSLSDAKGFRNGIISNYGVVT